MTDHTRNDLADTEDALRRALAQDAGRIAPPERLGAILRDAHRPPLVSPLDDPLSDGTHRDAPPARRTWLAAGAAAAAVVAAVAVGVAVADRGGSALPGATGTSTAPSGPATSGTGPSSGPSIPATGTSTGSTTTATGSVALPVYYVGLRAGVGTPAALVREFVPTDFGGAASLAARVERAVDTAAQAVDTPYAAIGPGQVTASVSAVSSAGIELTLSSDTATPTLTPIQEAAVTYTAQAAASLGDVPVTIDLNPHTFGPLARLGPFTRKDFGDVVLAPIWVDAPSRGQVLPAGRTITVTGLASVFEAQFAWQVLQGSTVVAHGSAMAAGGAPARGAYTISVDALQAGSYTLRLFEVSAKGDGSLAAETTTTFTVR